MVIPLTASAKFGYGGKQYLARITGLHSKFTFAREFIDRKSGKRRDHSEALIDEPGLYMTCDIDKHGSKDETFYVITQANLDSGKRLRDLICRIDKGDAMALAKLLDAGVSFADADKQLFPPAAPAPATPDVPQFDPCI